METKLFIVLDHGTECKIMATSYKSAFNNRERDVLELAGLGEGTGYSIQITDLTTGETNRDRYKWNFGRTMRQAHAHLESNFDNLSSGSIIDVRVLVGEAFCGKNVPSHLILEAN